MCVARRVDLYSSGGKSCSVLDHRRDTVRATMLQPQWEDVTIGVPAVWAPCVALLFAVVLAAVEQKWKTNTSSAILLFAEFEHLKEGLHNVWSTLSVLSALVGGLSLALLMAPQPLGSVGAHGFGVQGFALTCFYSLLFCLKAIVYSVVNLTFTEPLSNLNVAKYLLMNPNTVGNTAIPALIGLFLFLVGLLLWVLLQYRVAVAATVAVAALFMALQFLWYIRAKMLWDPRQRDLWVWPLLPEAQRPRHVTWGRHAGFVQLLQHVLTAEQRAAAADETTPVGSRVGGSGASYGSSTPSRRPVVATANQSRGD
jgi:hypothetical protein